MAVTDERDIVTAKLWENMSQLIILLIRGYWNVDSAQC